MPSGNSVKRSRGGAILLAIAILSSVGCQAWHSSSAIPGLKLTQGDRQILREVKNDPFPSPSEVGMKISE